MIKTSTERLQFETSFGPLQFCHGVHKFSEDGKSTDPAGPERTCSIGMSRPRKNFRYSLNQKLRRCLFWIMRWITPLSSEESFNPNQRIEKVLIVRATFRLGDCVLAIPAIWTLRRKYPHARIDFVSAPISAALSKLLPIHRHFALTRRFPDCNWEYPSLLWSLRSVHYDLAIDVSCSQSAMGSFLVGFSAARFRVGLRGKWDRWFNVRIVRPAEKNKYEILPALLKAISVEPDETLPSVRLTGSEIIEGGNHIKTLPGFRDGQPFVGVFVGGRKSWGKRWPLENFCRIASALHWYGVNAAIFVGPEEKDSLAVLRSALDPSIPVMFEPSIRKFAAMISNCDLFVTCDSGPMHLAYTLGVRTLAIFLKPNFDHWAPPSHTARVLYNSSGCSAEEVVSACLEEVAPRKSTKPNLSAARLDEGAPLACIRIVSQVIGRLEKSVHLKKLRLTSRIAQTLFLVSLGVYSFFFPPSGILDEGTWGETLLDTVEIGIPLLGCALRLWTVSHNQTAARVAPFAPALITTGPYALIRYPMFVANVFIGFGMIMLLESYLLIPVFLALLFLHLTLVIPSEEQYLQEKFGIAFTNYRYSVLRFFPTALPKNAFSWPSGLPFKEAALAAAIIMIVFLAEWFESPVQRRWVMTAVQSVLS